METQSGNPSGAPADTTPGRLRLSDLRTLATELNALGESIDQELLAPNKQKQSPVFTQQQLANLCKLSTDALSRRLDKAKALGLPTGYPANVDPTKTDKLARRSFSLKEVRQWVSACNVPYKRKNANDAMVVSVGFFKGGVGKTTLAMSLSQGLSLKGYRVLLVDLDPQASATSMLSLSPAQVETKNTFMPACYPVKDEEYSKTLLPLPTYWDGIDVVPANAELFGADFELPLRQMMQEPGFNFMNVLGDALEPLKPQYDFIIIDTPPSLSYVTLNAYWAANGIVMPLPPDGLPFASSIQFWNMFADLANLGPLKAANKEYSFLSVVPSMVDSQASTTAVIMGWMKMAYKNFLSNVEIPTTKAVKNAELSRQTVFDINKYVGSAKTYQRARDAFDKYVDEIETLTVEQHWKHNEKHANQGGKA